MDDHGWHFTSKRYRAGSEITFSYMYVRLSITAVNKDRWDLFSMLFAIFFQYNNPLLPNNYYNAANS